VADGHPGMVAGFYPAIVLKKNKDLSKLKAIMEKLADGQLLGPRYNDPPLLGKWNGH
jgi:mRNA-degrading endonuclease YafQ of YafQ-DinJ toxin-antitoxin module